ncbi:MAG: hypothetical protein E7261_03695 [Lachnospiraceae bacterium]|nr:hypothetical protein [Lachnospiraceae bacterium]
MKKNLKFIIPIIIFIILIIVFCILIYNNKIDISFGRTTITQSQAFQIATDKYGNDYAKIDAQILSSGNWCVEFYKEDYAILPQFRVYISKYGKIKSVSYTE